MTATASWHVRVLRAVRDPGAAPVRSTSNADACWLPLSSDDAAASPLHTSLRNQLLQQVIALLQY